MTLILKIPRHFDVFSDDELYAFCVANPELSIERDETGQLLLMPPPTGLEGSRRNMSLGSVVWHWNSQKRAGIVSDSSGGYTLPDNSMRAPDVGWVSNERIAAVSPDDLKKFAHVCPDFVIEFRSESDNVADLQAKMDKWVENGVRLGWLIDPQTQTTTIYRPDYAPASKPFTETLTGKNVLEGFTMNVMEVLEL